MTGIEWRGQDREGTARTGFMDHEGAISEWVFARYRAGWTWLILRNDAGDLIGEIWPSYDGTRTWWSE